MCWREHWQLGFEAFETYTYLVFPPSQAWNVFSGVLLWQSDFYPDHFFLWANSTLHPSRIVILFSEREFFLLFLLMK